MSPGHFRGGSTDHLKLGGKSQNPEKTLWEEPDIPDKSPPGTRVVLLAVPDGVPETWVQGVGDLMVMPPHPAWSDEEWKTLQEDALRFLQEWAGQVHRLGWEVLDLFGAHRTAPTVRFDCMGLVVLLKGRPVVAITEHRAAIKTASGGTMPLQRRAAPPVEQCLVWKLKGDQNLIRAALAVVPDLSDPEDIRAWLDERAAIREDSGTARADAETVAFDQLLWLWCEANPRQHTSGQCAACGRPFGAPVMSLPDDSQVCDKPDHACLIFYGNGRRMAAVGALKGLGIEPPRWWEL